jgi:hypothetical protein
LVFSTTAEVTAKDLLRFETDCSRLDLLSGTECTRPEDKVAILTDVSSCTGLRVVREGGSTPYR